MENTKAKNVIIIVLVILLIAVLGFLALYIYNSSNNNLAQRQNEVKIKQLEAEIASKNIDIAKKEQEFEVLNEKYEELRAEIEKLGEVTKQQSSTTSTTTTTTTNTTTKKADFAGTIFEGITEETFISMTITDNETEDADEVTIKSYKDAKEVLSKLSKLTYTKTTTTGIGTGDYEVDVNYRKNGKTINLRMTDTTVFGGNLGNYVYSISGSSSAKKEAKTAVKVMYNEYK